MYLRNDPTQPMRTSLPLVLAVIATTASAQIRIYPLDGDATETVAGEDGTLGVGTAAPSDTTDRFGTPSGAMYFNGDDLIEIPVAGLTNNEFSVAAWLLVSQNPGSLQMDYYAVGDNVQDQAFGVANDAFGTGFFQAGYVDVGGPIRVFATTLPTEDIWHHVVVTRSLTDLKLYVNGALINTTDATGTLPVYGTTPLAFIGNRNVNLRPWNGIIDDLRIWDHALTQEEVDLANAVDDSDGSPTVHAWPVPTSGSLLVTGIAPGERITIHDACGSAVLDLPASGSSTTFDLTGLASGVYVLHVRSSKGSIAQRIVKE